jgi:hypothetical protein
VSGRPAPVRLLLVVVGTVVALVGATACSSSGSGDLPVGVLDPQRLATVGLLTIDAFPPPWRAVPNQADPAGFDKCPEIAAALMRGRQARSTSPEFASGDREQAEQSVSVYDNVAGAALVMRTARLPAFERCLEQLLTTAAEQNAAATPAGASATVSARATTLAAPVRGAERVSYQVKVAIATAQARTAQYVDVDVMRVDRVVVALLSQRRGAPPQVDRGRLLSILAMRIDAANGTGN